MNTRRTIMLFAALLLVASVGCREITAPGGSSSGGSLAILVLDEHGDPVPDRNVELTNRGFVPIDDAVDWRGRTDDDGFVFPDLDPGTYSGVFSVGVGSFSSWLEPRMELSEGLHIADPRPILVPTTFRAPDDWDISYGSVVLHGDVPLDSHQISHQTHIHLTDDPVFLAPWIEGATYEVYFSQIVTYVRLLDDFSPASPDTIRLEWAPAPLQTRLTLAGLPVESARFRIVARTAGSSVGMEPVRSGTTFNYYGTEGIGELAVEPFHGVRFLAYSTPFEFRTDTITDVELGDFSVEFNLRSASGARLLDGSLRILSANSGNSRRFQVNDARTTVYLRPDHYKFIASEEGYTPVTLLAQVTSDSSFTFELEPEDGDDN